MHDTKQESYNTEHIHPSIYLSRSPLPSGSLDWLRFVLFLHLLVLQNLDLETVLPQSMESSHPHPTLHCPEKIERRSWTFLPLGKLELRTRFQGVGAAVAVATVVAAEDQEAQTRDAKEHLT